jgi:hypothetical protein
MAKDEEYGAAIAKGTQLLQMLNTDFAETTQLLSLPRACARGVFTSMEDLAKHGYIEQQKAQIDDETIMSRLAKALQYLGVDNKMVANGGKNIIVGHVHTENREMEGTKYTASQRAFQLQHSTNIPQATYAKLAQVCNHNDGVLIAHCNYTAP